MTAHAVYFYDDEAFLLDNVARFVTTGLAKRDTVIVVATQEHRIDLRARLMAENVIGLASPADARYVTLDAVSTLALFMLNDWPDERLFLKVIGQIIASSACDTPVRIYGEMVAVLWAQGKHRAAIRLEKLWNRLGQQMEFSLLCGYPTSTVTDPEVVSALAQVCECHSQVTGRIAAGAG